MKRRRDPFAQRLRSDDFAGHIVRWVAIFESRLDGVLGVYFTNRRHVIDFHQFVLPRLSFAEKIEILRQIKLPRPLKSHRNIVETLDRLRRLRNALAHHSYMPDSEINKLRSDKWILDFVSGYPKTVSREKNALENRFSLLWKHMFSLANQK